MNNTIYVLFSEDGYKDLFPLEFCKENNLLIIPVSYRQNGITYIDSLNFKDNMDYSLAADISVGINVLTMIFDNAVKQNIGNISFICPDGRFFGLKSDVQNAVRNYKRTSNSEKVNINVIDTKMLSIGVGAILKKSILLSTPVEQLLKNAKTFVIDTENQSTFYIKGNTISEPVSANFEKIISKCIKYIDKKNLDYTVSSSDTENMNNIIHSINRNCYSSHLFGVISDSVFHSKTIVSMF